ncbi:hypothetical protein FW789_13950 [Pseudomonas sp. 1121_17]
MSSSSAWPSWAEAYRPSSCGVSMSDSKAIQPPSSSA